MILDEHKIKKLVEQIVKEIKSWEKDDITTINEQSKEEFPVPIKEYDIIDFIETELRIDVPEIVEKSDLFVFIKGVQKSMGVQFEYLEDQIEHLRQELKEAYPNCTDLVQFVDIERLLYREAGAYAAYYVYEIHNKGEKFIIQSFDFELVWEKLREQIEKKFGRLSKK